MAKVKDLLGVCSGCGQTKMVKAQTQEEADRIATEECDCPEGELTRRKEVQDPRRSAAGCVSPGRRVHPR